MGTRSIINSMKSIKIIEIIMWLVMRRKLLSRIKQKNTKIEHRSDGPTPAEKRTSLIVRVRGVSILFPDEDVSFDIVFFLQWDARINRGINIHIKLINIKIVKTFMFSIICLWQPWLSYPNLFMRTSFLIFHHDIKN